MQCCFTWLIWAGYSSLGGKPNKPVSIAIASEVSSLEKKLRCRRPRKRNTGVNRERHHKNVKQRPTFILRRAHVVRERVKHGKVPPPCLPQQHLTSYRIL